MHKYFGMAALLAAQILFSCTQEEYGYSDSSSNGMIVARMAEPAVTRTAVGDAVEGSNAVGIMWTDGDMLGVFDATGTSQKCYAKVGQGTAATASFAASGTTAFDTPVYAYYPYDSANDSKDINSLTGTLPSTQNMDTGTLHGDYKYGRATTATGNGNYEFEFRHIFSLARFTIDASDTELEGETLKSITVTADRGGTGVALAGDFTFSAEDGSWTLGNEQQSSITLEWDTAACVLNEVQTCYMSLFPLIKTDDLFTITLCTENYTAEFTANCLVDLEAEHIYNFPLTLKNYSNLTITGSDGTVVKQGKFTCATLNVDGLPTFINSDGPGSSGTTTIGTILNGLGYEFIGVSEDFTYHNALVTALTDYTAGTYRGSATSIISKNDTDGLGFFWKTGVSAKEEAIVEYDASYGGLSDGANTLVAKGFRHYEVTVAEGVTVDVYITHMNTYSDSNGDYSESGNQWVSAQMSQLRQLRDSVLNNLATNNRPAIIMGDTNMRYTRHQIEENLIDYVAAKGYKIADPWIELWRGGTYPTYNNISLMIPSKFGGGSTDILCANDQRGEVVDKVWYINVPDAAVQLEATSCKNDVDNFAESTETVSYDGVTYEDEYGNITTGQTVSYTKVTGYADHFPVVVSFRYTYTSSNED